MAETTTALQKGPPEGSLQWYLDKPEYKARFNQILGSRSPQFASSLITIANSNKLLREAEPRSLIAAGMIAATLDLPIDRNLGFAWIVPYRDNQDGGKQIAQFQMGFKGYVQLALRSGQYSGMNAFKVNEEALGRVDPQTGRKVYFDEIMDPIIDGMNLDETKEAVGYAFAWRLVNGFSKIVYWPKAKVAAHAEQYSQAHKGHIKKGYPKGRDCRWCLDFDAMALKTVVANSIRRWGIMRIEMTDQMRVAMERDQSASIDIESAPVYVDAVQDEHDEAEENGERANANQADDLASKLKAGRAGNSDTKPLVQPETQDEPEGEKEEGEQAPEQTPEAKSTSPSQSTSEAEKRENLADLFKQVAATHTHKAATDRLEMATGRRTVEKVKAEKLAAGIDAMLQLQETKPGAQ